MNTLDPTGVPAAGSTFRSLKGFNYRMWAGGAIVSNVGTWMQRTAQDWIVLTQLTDAAAHEFVMKKIFPRLGEVDSTDALLALMPR